MVNKEPFTTKPYESIELQKFPPSKPWREPEREPGREPEREPWREPEREPGREPEPEPYRTRELPGIEPDEPWPRGRLLRGPDA